MTFKEIMSEFEYEVKTSFWDDFSIADKFGETAVRDTYKRAFNEWKDNHIYLTEFVIVLNHKIWQHWENNSKELAKVYDELWRKADQYACSHLKDDKLDYYYRITD